MIECGFNETIEDFCNIGKVADHPRLIELLGREFNLNGRIVAVRVSAFAVVIEQSVPVTESKLLNDAVQWHIEPLSTGLSMSRDATVRQNDRAGLEL